MEDTPKKPHAIVIAYPLQGHLIPIVHLAMKLASKGFTITFINTKSIEQYQISRGQPHLTTGADIFSGARESGLDILYATASDGLPLEFDRFQNLVGSRENQLHHVWRYVDEVVGEIVRTAEPPVNFLVADTFQLWSSVICEKYGLVNVSFWTQIALVFTLYYHLHTHTKIYTIHFSILLDKIYVYNLGRIWIGFSNVVFASLEVKAVLNGV